MDEYDAIGSAYLGDYLGCAGQHEFPEDDHGTYVVVIDGSCVGTEE